MPHDDETKFVLHGLDVDNRVVRAGVFAQKLSALLNALRTADKSVNLKPAFEFMLSGLEVGSAAVTIREKQKRQQRPNRSAIEALASAATAIYNGDRAVEQLSLELVDRVQKLTTGVAKRFSHAELAFSGNNVIRIDDYLSQQTRIAHDLAAVPARSRNDRYYRGLAVGSFDGVLKEIDARGTVLRGKLILSAGGVEIDCAMNKERVPEARASFDKHVVVDGVAHYDGSIQLPVRLDVRSIRILSDGPNLLRWRGALSTTQSEDIDSEW